MLSSQLPTHPDWCAVCRVACLEEHACHSYILLFTEARGLNRKNSFYFPLNKTLFSSVNCLPIFLPWWMFSRRGFTLPHSSCFHSLCLAKETKSTESLTIFQKGPVNGACFILIPLNLAVFSIWTTTKHRKLNCLQILKIYFQSSPACRVWEQGIRNIASWRVHSERTFCWKR